MMLSKWWFAVRLFVIFVLTLLGPQASWAAESAHPGPSLGDQLPLIAVFPFVAMLLSIAVFPLFAPHWWEHNRNKAIVALVLSVPLAAYLVITFGDAGVHQLAHKLA